MAKYEILEVSFFEAPVTSSQTIASVMIVFRNESNLLDVVIVPLKDFVPTNKDGTIDKALALRK